MALRSNMTLATGITIGSAYHRVEHIELSKQQLTAVVRSYVDPSDKPFFAERLYTLVYTLSGDNPIVQAYHQIKQLPDYADAEDC